MGLRTTHDCWTGSYVFFAAWRAEIAKAAGFPPLLAMKGFCDDEDSSPEQRSAKTVARWRGLQAPIPWDAYADDPLAILLNHSDCDGEIAAEHCVPIAERLEVILPLLPTGDVGGESWWEITNQFARGLRAAAAHGEAVEFH